MSFAFKSLNELNVRISFVVPCKGTVKNRNL